MQCPLSSFHTQKTGYNNHFAKLRLVPVLQDSCIISRECNFGDFSLSRKDFHVANVVHSWGSRPWPTCPMSSDSPWSTKLHSKEGKDRRCANKSNQPWRLAYQYITAVTSHIEFEVPNCQIKKCGVLAEIAKFNAHQVFPLYSSKEINKDHKVCFRFLD